MFIFLIPDVYKYLLLVLHVYFRLNKDFHLM